MDSSLVCPTLHSYSSSWSRNLLPGLQQEPKKAQHITPVIKSLHWPSVSHRIGFKTLLLVLRSLNRLGPRYFPGITRRLVAAYSPFPEWKLNMMKLPLALSLKCETHFFPKKQIKSSETGLTQSWLNPSWRLTCLQWFLINILLYQMYLLVCSFPVLLSLGRKFYLYTNLPCLV